MMFHLLRNSKGSGKKRLKQNREVFILKSVNWNFEQELLHIGSLVLRRKLKPKDNTYKYYLISFS